MIIYADLVFLTNFLINYIFLFSVEKVFKDKPNHFRITLASIFGGLLIITYLFNYYILLAFKIIGGLLISFLGFKVISFSKRVIKTSLFYLLNYTLVGVASAFDIKQWYFLLLCIFAVIIIIILENYKKYHIFISRSQYNVSITFENTCFKLKGFLDTGNFSMSKDGVPIIYIDYKYYYKTDKFETININTVSGNAIAYAYKPDQFTVSIGRKELEKEVMVIFTKLSNFECLLNTTMFL